VITVVIAKDGEVGETAEETAHEKDNVIASGQVAAPRGWT
jgi:hypothetical protein